MSDVNEYSVGQAVVIQVEFRDRAGTLADPEQGVIRTRHDLDEHHDDVELEDPSVSRIGEGVFEMTVVDDRAGRFYYKGVSTAGIRSASRRKYFLYATDEAEE